MKRFLEYLQKDKSAQPNIDFFSRDELKAVIKRFKADVAEGNLEDSQRSSGALDSSTANMFDVAMNRVRSQSFIRRQQTKMAEETILSRHTGAVCVIAGINQFITS